MLTCISLFAVEVDGSGSPWGVRGTSTSSSNYGFVGHNNYGVYGFYNSTSNYGYLGGYNYGAYGRSSSGNYAYLGGTYYAAFAFHSSGNYALLGSSGYGAYTKSDEDNYCFLSGSDFSFYAPNAGGAYGIIGTSSGVGIEASGSLYAGNFEGDVNITGDLYVSGDKDNIIKLDDGTWVTMSATEAPYPEYTISGRAKLSNGTARIEFEEPYPQVISDRIPIKVIVTPEGSYSGIYVKDVSVNGFIAVSEVGDVNATFSWMAIARVKGREEKRDYQAVTAKMLRLETAQRELGLSSPARRAAVDADESLMQMVEETSPELRLSVAELNAHGSVEIGYQLPRAGDVSLSIYDASGRLVKTLVSAQRDQGGHSIVWDCTDASSRPVSAGVYYVRLEDGQSQETAKVTIIK